MATQSSIGKEHESTSLKALLDQIPGTKELTTHAKTAKWHLLGVQLELDDQELRGCSELVKMYDLWLNNKAEMATRRNLLKALRFIKENKVAWEYENYLKTKAAENEASPEDVQVSSGNVEMTTPPSTKQEEIIDTTLFVSSCEDNDEPSSKDSAKKKKTKAAEYTKGGEDTETTVVGNVEMTIPPTTRSCKRSKEEEVIDDDVDEVTTPPITTLHKRYKQEKVIIDTTSDVSSCEGKEETSSKDNAKKKICRQLVMIVVFGFGVIFLAWLVWYLIHAYGENTRWYYLEEYLLEIVWIALGVTVAAVIFSCIIYAFGDNSWWELFVIILVISLLIVIDCQIPSNDKTKLVKKIIETVSLALLPTLLLLCGCKLKK